MKDKYFNEKVFEQFRKFLKLPSEIATPESNDDMLMSLLSIFFIQLMNSYLESLNYIDSAGNITME
jgi:hypothetical protein